MLIAIVNGQTVEQIGDYQSLFPNTSFTSSGPNADFYTQYSCLPVSNFVIYNQETQELQPTEPYIQNNVVYTVKAVAKTIESTTTASATTIIGTSNSTIASTGTFTVNV